MKIEKLKILDSFNQLKELKVPRDSERTKYVEWQFENKKVVLNVDKNNNQFIRPYVFNGEELVVFYKDFKEFPFPNNAAILNPDGTVRVHLLMPELISEKYLEYQQKVGKQTAQASRRFLYPVFKDDGTTCMWIGFNYDWFESRFFNLKTGEFGACEFASRE